MLHLTLKRLEASGCLEVKWGEDIHMETGGVEDVQDVEQSESGQGVREIKCGVLKIS